MANDFQNQILQACESLCKILDGRFYSPSLKDVAWLERAQLIFHTLAPFGMLVEISNILG